MTLLQAILVTIPLAGTWGVFVSAVGLPRWTAPVGGGLIGLFMLQFVGS